MQIKIGRLDAVLCEAAISDAPNEEGLYWCEFYPIALLLELRNTNKLLDGHPMVDLEGKKYNSGPPFLTAKLRSDRIKPIKRRLANGKMMAISKSFNHRGEQYTNFHFVRGVDYLNTDDLFWLEAVRVNGGLYVERVEAELQSGIEAKGGKEKKPKLKRKERQRLESIGSFND